MDQSGGHAANGRVAAAETVTFAALRAAPLAGARIEVRIADGSRRAVETRADGTFAVPASATSVVVSHVGYTTRAVVLDSTGELTVRLDASPLQLDQVTVTATRAAKRLEDAPGSVSVIGRASLDTRSIARVDQAVGMTWGVYNHRPNVLDDGHGSLELRGLAGQKRTLVMLDGVPMNDGHNGGFRFAGLAAEDLERVEVVRGPSSSPHPPPHSPARSPKRAAKRRRSLPKPLKRPWRPRNVTRRRRHRRRHVRRQRSRTPSTRLTQTRRQPHRPGRTDPRKSSCADTISRNSRLPRRRCLPRERCCCYASRPC